MIKKENMYDDMSVASLLLIQQRKPLSAVPCFPTDVRTTLSLAWPGSHQPRMLGFIWIFLFLSDQVDSSGRPQPDPRQQCPGAPAEGLHGGEEWYQLYPGPEASRWDQRRLVHPHHNWHLWSDFPLPVGQQHPQKER